MKQLERHTVYKCFHVSYFIVNFALLGAHVFKSYLCFRQMQSEEKSDAHSDHWHWKSNWKIQVLRILVKKQQVKSNLCDQNPSLFNTDSEMLICALTFKSNLFSVRCKEGKIRRTLRPLTLKKQLKIPSLFMTDSEMHICKEHPWKNSMSRATYVIKIQVFTTQAQKCWFVH